MKKFSFKEFYHQFLNVGLKIKSSEFPLVIWSFLYFFFILSSYYVLRPLRDEMGIQGGVENLPWMFTGTFFATLFVVPVFGWIATHFPKKRIVPAFYGLFFIILIVFFVLFKRDISREAVAISFFIWISVFNLFLVSVFWSFMVDTYSQDQSERLFGIIAAGGTSGAILGPVIAATLPEVIGTENLFLVSATFILGALIAIWRMLSRRSGSSRIKAAGESRSIPGEKIIGGTFWDGFFQLMQSPYLLGIGLFIVLYSGTSTFVYFAQANILEESISSSAGRTQVFALIDFSVNTLTLLGQVFLTGRLTDYFGPAPSLVSLPVVTVVGFILLAVSPVLWTIVIFQILRRSSNYAFSKPAREVLFSPLNDSKKYKGKNVVDTLVYRAGDATTGWFFSALQGIGLTIGGISLIGSAAAVGWIVLCYKLVSNYYDKSNS